jgi:DNA-binding GntR family transcriptional regulator
VAKIFTLPSIERTTAAEQVTRILRARILSGELAPGSTLPEVKLASSLDVSRNTIREAMRTLEAEGLVRHSVHRGVSVASLALDDVTEIFRVRRMLELAAVKATRNKPAEAFQPMKQAVERLRRAVSNGDWVGAVEQDMLFHRLLVSFLGSSRVEHFYWILLSELRLGLAALDRTGDKPADYLPQHHQRMLNHLLRGNVEGCTKMLHSHLNDSELRLRAYIHERPTASPAEV